MSDVSEASPAVPDLDAVVASLRADAADAAVFFQVLAGKLADTMPGNVTVEREGGLFKREHPVKRMSVSVGDDVFEAGASHGVISCRRSHAVRGIRLRTEELGFDDWLRALADVLLVQSRQSAAATAALRALVT